MNDSHDSVVSFDQLVEIMARLRGEGGCPWDKMQDFSTIKDYFLEEVHEALDAIERGEPSGIMEELGDVLFEVCFLARLAEERGWFTIHDSIRSIHDKLIRRHPHVFGEECITEAEEVPGRWMQLKAQEKSKKKKRESILDGISRRLPPLLQALRISERAVAVGFEWEDVNGVFEKLDEEIGELKRAVHRQEPRERLMDELGDVLFTAVNVGRKLNILSHDALLATMEKFRRRFAFMEKKIREAERVLGEVPAEELEELWGQAKKGE